MTTLRLFRSCFLIVTLACLVFAPNALAQSSAVRVQNVEPHPVNLDFEQGALGQAPDGWRNPTTVNFGAELTAEKPKSGKYSAVLFSKETTAARSPFGNLMQAIDATPFRGRRLRFRASVRVEGNETARAQLWMRVDRAGGKPGFFDNMMNRPITTSEWGEYEIIGDVEEDAEVLNIGMLLLGKGKAWLDAVSIEDLGKVVVRADPPRPVTTRGLENLIAFSRLLGYVRHFHPSDEAAATNWNAFAVEGVLAVESAKDAPELAEKLTNIFRPVAPTVRVFPTGKPLPPLPAELTNNSNVPSIQVVSWKHTGFGPGAAPDATYHSERVRTAPPSGPNQTNLPDPRKPFTADLGAGVSCVVPLALFADAKGTLPHTVPGSTEAKSSLIKYTGNDRATRLAGVALGWNILQHFYPYFDVVKTDWPGALKNALASAATDENDLAFLITLRRMVAQLHDGHGGAYYPGEARGFSVPAIFGWVEGRLVITDVAAGANDVQPGDIVLKVNGKPTTEALAELEALVSAATPQCRRFVALELLADGLKDSELRVDVQSENGQARSVILRRTVETESLNETRPPKISELKPGIFYAALDRIKDEDFNAVLPQLEQAKGIVFDLRGYPTVSPMVISHLIDVPVTSARWMVPIITKPDHATVDDYETGGRWDLKPIAPRLKGKIAFLTDGRAISYAESYMGIIEAYKLAEIVGEPTAGTNGNINPFVLPGNYTVVWTGMKVLKHDGSQHHGIGIHPTVPVSRTIKGIREKRDEQLERAVSIVSP